MLVALLAHEREGNLGRAMVKVASRRSDGCATAAASEREEKPNVDLAKGLGLAEIGASAIDGKRAGGVEMSIRAKRRIDVERR